VVVCLERGADLHTAQLMPLPLTVSRFNKIQIDCTFLVPAQLCSPRHRAVKRVCVCTCGSMITNNNTSAFTPIHIYVQTLDNAHNSQVQGSNLRRGRSLDGKRTVDINDEQTHGFLDEI